MAFSAFSRSRRPAGSGPDGPSSERPVAAQGVMAQDVVLVYEAVLGRSPSPQEIAHQQAHAASLRDLLLAVGQSDERSAKAASGAVHERDADTLAPRPANVVNVYTEELEPFGMAPGTWSADGVAVTGRRGWVFLGGGTNTILDQYRGAFALPEDFDARWTQALEVRRRGAEALGAAFVALVVPDKLAVLAADFPDPLPRMAEAPAAMLAARPELDLLYPVVELAAVPEGAYLRTDTHLTYAGNAALARSVGAALGVTIEHELASERINRYVTSGDLGSRYSPPIVEVIAAPNDYGDAEVIASNRDEIAAVGAHVGTRLVLRNERATDHRTVVVFGDSYGFSASHYQGLSWFLAQAFREVHFLWVPFGWDPDYAAEVGADVVICQGAERFAIRPPEIQVDVRALEAQALGRTDAATSPPPASPAAADRGPAADQPPSWRERFPPPERPWTAPYAAAHEALVGAAIDDPALRAAIGSGALLPDGYAAGFDERVVEYPWMFAQGLGGRVLDAGSTFNHQHIVERAQPLVDELTITTLAPEGHAFVERAVSYVFSDLRALPFRDGWFDTVVSLSTLEHVGMDNAFYGVGDAPAPDPDAAVAHAARELRRITRPGGRILLSVPYGRREDHGWFRQFDADGLSRLIAAFEPSSHTVSLFAHAPSGWQRCSAQAAADLAYRDAKADPSPAPDGAAAARAVACVTIDL
jgi:alginate O-acetyltransferase complex protein AlgJ